MSLEASPEDLRRRLVVHAGLHQARHAPTAAGIRALLGARHCIQLDPLDRMGTNAELVVAARIRGLERADLGRALFDEHGPNAAFEHFAKERCLLPAAAFPAYRDQAVQTPWWRLTRRLERLPQGLLDAVLAEVTERGPLTSLELSDHGRVDPIDWSGWKGTSKAGSLALEVLWTRCQVVVAGWRGRQKIYDLPQRALGDRATAAAPSDFHRWGVLERVRASGLLSRSSGPWWSMLGEARKDGTVGALLEEGRLVEVGLPGTRRRWLAEPGFLNDDVATDDAFDDHLRILGPLDPLMWDRDLVQRLFDFEYVWEVYKPASRRRWGYYVCPLLHRGRLVGRVEGRVVDGQLEVLGLWREQEPFPEEALRAAWAEHARFLGVVPGSVPA